MIVENVDKKNEVGCSCSDWLEHWSKFSGEEPPFCAALGCEQSDLVGARVRVRGLGSECYVVPLCSSHTKVAEAIEIYSAISPISCNPATTCG